MTLRPSGRAATGGRLTSVVLACASLASSGCAALLGNPATELGAAQDRYNRRINAQYDPGMPAKLRTDYEARGREIDGDASAREWREFFDLFRWHPAKLPFRDEPSRCPDPGTYQSCSATQGCECRQRGGAAPRTLPAEAAADDTTGRSGGPGR